MHHAANGCLVFNELQLSGLEELVKLGLESAPRPLPARLPLRLSLLGCNTLGFASAQQAALVFLFRCHSLRLSLLGCNTLGFGFCAASCARFSLPLPLAPPPSRLQHARLRPCAASCARFLFRCPRSASAVASIGPVESESLLMSVVRSASAFCAASCARFFSSAATPPPQLSHLLASGVKSLLMLVCARLRPSAQRCARFLFRCHSLRLAVIC